MRLEDCTRLRPDLGALADGELRGQPRVDAEAHVAACPTCADELGALRELGDRLRDAAAVRRTPAPLQGLAAGVLGRLRAEDAQSWRATFAREFGDWRWAIVGVGAVSAAFVSLVLVSALLLFGPRPERGDSLAALMTNLTTPAGTLFVVATAPGGEASSLMQVSPGAANGRALAAAIPAAFSMPTERELVGALTATVAPVNGPIDLDALSEEDRRYVEALLDEIGRLRGGRWVRVPGNHVTVHRLLLVTRTAVTAKAL